MKRSFGVLIICIIIVNTAIMKFNGQNITVDIDNDLPKSTDYTIYYGNLIYDGDDSFGVSPILTGDGLSWETAYRLLEYEIIGSISFTNTTRYFIIDNCTINANASGNGFFAQNSTNIKMENSIIKNVTSPIYIHNCTNINYTNSTITGCKLVVENVIDFVAQNITNYLLMGTMITLNNSQNVTIINSALCGYGSTVIAILNATKNVTVMSNTLIGNANIIEIYSNTSELLFENNSIMPWLYIPSDTVIGCKYIREHLGETLYDHHTWRSNQFVNVSIELDLNSSIDATEFVTFVMENNTINDKPYTYLYNKTGEMINASSFTTIVLNCSDILLDKFIFTSTNIPIIIGWSQNVSISTLYSEYSGARSPNIILVNTTNSSIQNSVLDTSATNVNWIQCIHNNTNFKLLNTTINGGNAVFIENPSIINSTIAFNTFQNIGTKIIVCGQNTINTTFYYNVVNGVNLITETISETTNKFDNGTHGNIWGDYLERYPYATKIDHYWNIPYDLAMYGQDRFPIAVNTPPTINHPNDMNFYYRIPYYRIGWHIDDTTNFYVDESFYWILVNSSITEINSSWTPNSDINVTIDRIIGSYNYTIVVTDGEYTIEDSVIVTINNDVPIIVAMNNSANIPYGQKIMFSWNVTDYYCKPDTNYTILCDSQIIDQTLWTIGSHQINYQLWCTLSLGLHNFTMFMDDGYGKKAQASILIIITNTKPIISSAPTLLVMKVGVMQEIDLNITDSTVNVTGSSIQLIRNSTKLTIDQTIWDGQSNVKFQIFLTDLNNREAYTIVVNDGLGLNASVSLRITSYNQIPILYSNRDEIEFIVGDGYHFIDWEIEDDSVVNGTYVIYNGETIIDSGNWNSSTTQISYDVSTLSIGKYEFIIKLNDGHNIVNCTISVSVIAPNDDSNTVVYQILTILGISTIIAIVAYLRKRKMKISRASVT